MPLVVALVPARCGSQRVPGKNMRLLSGHPLIAFTIASSIEADIFDAVIVSTDSPEIAEAAERYGALVPALRPAELAGTTSPDIDWVLHAMADRDEEMFAILRPTSPFRSAETLTRAFDAFVELGAEADSIRAVELCKQHPAKMWVRDGRLLRPFVDDREGRVPGHSMQYQSLPEVYVQNSSLEIAWSHVLSGDRPSISGERVAPFFTRGDEGFSIDYPEDLERAERLIAQRRVAVPRLLEAVA
jgi:CMP-N,N'-diacetyllegionaminic acid synthase